MNDLDYRLSHLGKGDDYDKFIAEDPVAAYFDGAEKRIVRQIVPKLFSGKIPRYLDFACGTGRLTSLFETMSDRSYGIDISPSMLAEAKIRCSTVEFVHADITREKCDVEPVDLISSFRFFPNAQDSLRKAVLSELSKLLKPRGYLVINNHRNPHAIHYGLHRLTGGRGELDFSYFRMRRLLKEAGFEIVRTYGIGWWIIRSSFFRKEVLESSLGRLLEPLSRWGFMAPICPDMVVLARKTA